MLVEYSIDWLSGSVENGRAHYVMNYIGQDWLPIRGMNGYDVGHKDAKTGVKRYTSSTRPDMGTNYLATGAVLLALGTTLNIKNCLSSMLALGFDFLRASRIDLAIDIFDGGDAAHRVADAARRAAIITTARKVAVYQSTAGDAGCTTYLGSRNSPKMVRIYDKDAESNGVRSCTRIELELHGLLAAQVWRDIYSAPDPAEFEKIATSCIRSVVQYSGDREVERVLSWSSGYDYATREPSLSIDTEWIDRQLVSYFARNAMDNQGDAILLKYLISQVERRIRAE